MLNDKNITPPLTELDISTKNGGFYNGFATSVAVPAKIIISALVVWAIFWPVQSGAVLNGYNSLILDNFAAWYIWVVAFFVIVCLILALWPAAGRLNLGLDGERPEFSNFSWFSMMFGAGIGVGMLTWAVAEPVAHFQNNPEVIQGLTTGGAEDNIRMAYKWSFLHWGFGAWACYAICGLSLAFFSYRRGLPLTIRSGLTPLFGKALAGVMGHIIDIVAVVATILGVAQTLGFGVDQFVAGLTRIGIGGLADAEGAANTLGIVVALLFIMGASTLSALSGVGKGIKWLSNINMVLSIVLLGFFILFGATWFGASAWVVGLWDYVLALPQLSFSVFGSVGLDALPASVQALPEVDAGRVMSELAGPGASVESVATALAVEITPIVLPAGELAAAFDAPLASLEAFTAGASPAIQALPADDISRIYAAVTASGATVETATEALAFAQAPIVLPGDDLATAFAATVESRQATWQGWWPVFYWAWWIAFAPFVGLFLARISRGRSIREFVLGALIVPALMCFVWFAWAGGTAIDLELNGEANGIIFDAANGDKIFAMTEFMLSPISEVLSWLMAVMIVVLLMTFLVTSADSAVLIVNTINAAGDEGPKARPHILFWGAALALVVGGLLVSGGTSAIQTAMVIGALPFSIVMALMAVALLKAIYNDTRRAKAGVPMTHDKIEGATGNGLPSGLDGVPAE